ncbi:hypothetical protein SEPCBS119000_003617 [Sporothrix epigloea]|uniref:HNH nuclease domain-containing protein n=1 Tax=Sporothrix epigloea TaxID=1892477 RepID=A0ABP0DMM1_9PEZI
MSSPSLEEFEERFLKLYRRDKEAALAVLTLIESAPEALEVMAADLDHEREHPEDYITNLEERQRLFSKIRPFLPKTVEVNATVMAIFMVLPLLQMQSLADKLAEYDPLSEEDVARYSASSTYRSLEHGLKYAVEAIASFLGKSTKLLKTPSPMTTPDSGQPGFEGGQSASPTDHHVSPSLPDDANSYRSYPAGRYDTAVGRTEARDGYKCVLTETEDPLATRIFPRSASPATNRARYIAKLVSLWGDEKADAWMRQSSSLSVTESPRNLLCMTRQHGLWWRMCRLALRPMRTSDPCTIKVQLHWLRRADTTPDTPLSGSMSDLSLLCGVGENGAENDFQSWRKQPVAYRKSGLPLRTGQIFTIRAEDPADLPSFDLLDMRWNLQRIAVMSGAVDPEDGAQE